METSCRGGGGRGNGETCVGKRVAWAGARQVAKGGEERRDCIGERQKDRLDGRAQSDKKTRTAVEKSEGSAKKLVWLRSGRVWKEVEKRKEWVISLGSYHRGKEREKR